MIYLKPIGGLCNRMRTMDSVISLCKKYNRDLTVLWIRDSSLNSPFTELFEEPVFNEFSLRILDCPVGFPEDYPSLSKGNEKYPTINKSLIRQLKNGYKFRFISKEHKRLRDKINTIKSHNQIKNEELIKIYSSEQYVEVKSARDMDDLFISKVEPVMTKLFSESDADIYISSCYRLSTIDNNYTAFKPNEPLREKIKTTTATFTKTIGLHIRRSDHVTSKNFSTTQKFIELVESILVRDSKASFFLSTDDSKTKDELISKYGTKIISNEIDSFDRNSVDAVKDAVIDLYCLASTKTVYGSHHSSFSQTAADIGIIEEITVK